MIYSQSKAKRKYGLKQDGTLGWIVRDSIGAKMSPARDRFLYKPEFATRLFEYKQVECLTTVDWLRFTSPDPDAVEYILSDFTGLLLETDLVLNEVARKHLGYEHSYSISLWYNNNIHIVGFLAYTLDVDGGFTPGISVEFTGDGCRYLRDQCSGVWRELPYLIDYYRARITRLDIALDIDGQYARDNNINIATIGAMSDLFQSDFLRNGKPMSKGTAGDWSIFAFDGVTVDSYDPSKHAPSGLTLNIGRRTGAYFFRIYEKGKQLAGLTGEDEDLAWIRIEQEIKRDKDGSNIPLEIILNPDAFFALNREIRKIMLDYAALMSVEQRIVSANRLAAKAKNLLLSKKIYWLRRTYGRTIRTLLNSGLFVEDIVEMIQRECGLKNLIFDLELKDYEFRKIEGNI